MDSEGAATPGDLRHELSLREAARLYDVSIRTLRDRVRQGRISAAKVSGPGGREWRVSERALEASGLSRRSVPRGAVEDPSRVTQLEEELAVARHALAAERSRADQADRELGQAMLESGRLRSALARARREVERCTEPSAEDFATGA